MVMRRSDTAKARMEAHSGLQTIVHLDSRFDSDLAELCGLLGVCAAKPAVGPKSKPKRWPRFSWDRWFERDAPYADRGWAVVRAYDLR